MVTSETPETLDAPNKRIKELLDFHQLGWTGDGELAERVTAEAATRIRQEKRTR